MNAQQQSDPYERRSLRALALALDEFEPFVPAVVPDQVLNRLVEEGLAEKGPSRRPAVASNGYRLTDRGWERARQLWNWRATPSDRTDHFGPPDATH